jgi:signal transduction histidine kinase/HPt (histidine-containing phosphotransfer) domain-containing protein/ActR/RegA family two-component response regulator
MIWGRQHPPPPVGTALTLLVAGSVNAQNVRLDDLNEPNSLAGTWLFNPGDDPAFAQSGYDDSQWQQVSVPARSPEGYPGYSGTGWYRLTVQLGAQVPVNSLAVMLGAVESAYELYAGGQKLGGIGRLPPQASVVYNRHAIYEIPPSAVNSQRQLLLAIRVWRNEAAGAGGASGPYEGPFLIGGSGDLNGIAARDSLMPGMLMAALYLVVGLYHLFIARRNPSMREFLWFGWFAIGLSLYSMETSQWRFNIDIPFLWHLKLEYTALYLLPFLATEVLARIARIPPNLVSRLFKYLFLVFAVVVAIVPTIRIHYLTLPNFQYLAAVWALYTAGLMGWHAFRGNREAAAITILLLLLLVSLINDIFMSGALLGITETIYIVFGMTILLMAVLMANHYTATLAKLELSVEERTVDLLQTNKQLEEANSIKEQFLANMSHELRTPMNAIIGLTQLGLKTDLSEKQRDYLNKVEASAINLLGIIDSVLDFSKLHAGELQCVNNPFDLRRLLDELEIATGEQLTDRDELNISFICDPQIPATVVGDAAKLATVLRNLLSNAVKFTPAGDINVAARVVSSDGGKVAIEFSVTDSGIGISEAQQEKLFSVFSQADNSFSRAYGGTGLGLTTANELVKLMGAQIAVNSEEGKGSSFSFQLDFLYSEATPEQNQAADSPSPGSDKDLSAILGAEILVVDDSQINLQIASELLQQAGFKVDSAHDGQQAVAMVGQKPYDCVLMDLQMPVMDGIQATETIRADSRFKNLPVLAMTANSSDADRARASQAGMNALIPKPIDQRLLFDSLLQWISPGERDFVIPAQSTVQESQLQLPDALPGLSVQEGLGRVGGNSRLYLKLLRDMNREYQGTAEEITELLEKNQLEQAAQLAHKLRGIANNLGAFEVGLLSGEIEQSAKDGMVPADATLQELSAALSSLEGLINQLVASDSSAPGSEDLDKQAITSLLDQLTLEIEESNPAATDTNESLLAGLAEGMAGEAELTALGESLDIFDFANAARHLAAARAALEQP